MYSVVRAGKKAEDVTSTNILHSLPDPIAER
jgi:hypothetical protein